MSLRLIGVGATWAISAVAATLAFVAVTHGHTAFASVPAAVPALTLDLGVTPLAAPFLALLAILGVAVGAWGLRGDRPVDAALIAGFAAAMLFVLVARSVAAFVLAWELMSLVSAFLVAANHSRRGVRRATFVYLVVAQSGALCILVALLLLAGHATGPAFSDIATSAATIPPGTRTAAFILALVGFGSKAGLLPLHFWLPRAHPVAPPGASALLSGAMLKVALYGLCVVAFELAAPAPAGWGIALVILGTVSAIGGVLYALVDHDLKRLLAYHSVENVGIITIGIGVALLARSAGVIAVATLALVAALFHAVNHGLFKALLFMGAGIVAKTQGTVDLERLGGLWRRLTWTAPLFLVGCAAIVALPPFNGFASEWLTFQSLVGGFALRDPATRIVLLGASAGLALTGGLAAACFVKVFGVAFLGSSRRPEQMHPGEPPRERFDGTTFAQALLAGACAALGLIPALAVTPLVHVAAVTLGTSQSAGLRLAPLASLSVLPIALVVLPAAGVLACLALATRRGLRRVPTWTCGSPVTPAAQYTATAFSKPLRLIFGFVLRPEHRRLVETGASTWFPSRIVYRIESRDVIDEAARRFGAIALYAARRSRALQSGNLRLYLAYAVAALGLVVVVARQ
ncbi:MAG TPA: proton-conducting transporter membrane subunit [Candidatus Baltobacteraceae bacterium]|nr:proton-conducting transporter membrane subunit [Candidatus Baltobacteraceae bacterium]